jgi:hypothetical protein
VRRYTHADTVALRAQARRTALLMITDKCPVSCPHCSVGSLPTGPSVTDWPLFDQLLTGIASLEGLHVVAISGGEPFSDRRALVRAVDHLRGAGKDIIVFSSGYWARPERPPQWIADVLRATSTVFLSTDGFHQGRVAVKRFVHAVGHVADAGCRIVVHTLDEKDGVARLTDLLRDRIAGWEAIGEVVPIAALAQGRGRAIFGTGRTFALHELSRCRNTASPTIRYDGVVTGCCNEGLVMGGGPSGLRPAVRNASEMRDALADLSGHPVLRTVASAGPSGLPGLLEDVAPEAAEDLRNARFADVCGPCWVAFEHWNRRHPITSAAANSAVPAGGIKR